MASCGICAVWHLSSSGSSEEQLHTATDERVLLPPLVSSI